MSAPMPNPFDTNSAVIQPPTAEPDGAGAKPVLASSPSEAAIVSCQEPVAAGLSKAEYKTAAIAVWERIKPAMAQAIRDMPGDMYFPPKEWLPELFPKVTPTDHIGDLIHSARRLKCPPFIPDYEAMETAMHNPGSPRALEGEPTWEDEAPLFLRMTGVA